jgi:hypothetical protein
MCGVNNFPLFASPTKSSSIESKVKESTIPIWWRASSKFMGSLAVYEETVPFGAKDDIWINALKMEEFRLLTPVVASFAGD